MFIHLLRPGPPLPLTVRSMTNLLKPQFNDEGSNSRTFENAVHAKFVKYMREAASKSKNQWSSEIDSITKNHMILWVEFAGFAH